MGFMRFFDIISTFSQKIIRGSDMRLLSKSFFFYRKSSSRNNNRFPAKILPFLVFLLCFPLVTATVNAAITGPCSNCHTMHNSQNGTAMALLGGESGASPNPFLTSGSCLGCHAMGSGNKIETIGATQIPQVRHHDGTGDLAAGNFAYMLEGAGASDTKGHNVVDFGVQDANLYGPPGGINLSDHNNGYNVNDTVLTCAGEDGCHGYRKVAPGPGIKGVEALHGAHHGNVDGKCDIADTPANSYRFLFRVWGLENQADKWQNVSSGSHNEYFGQTMPKQLTGCDGGTSCCHQGFFIGPPNHTMSEFCATCHGNFHTLTSGSSSGIGTGTNPFIRHPTDIALPNRGEYILYNGDKSYSVIAPVARAGTVPDVVSSTVDTSTGNDVVMCLSCHGAHATDFPDILRWDYDNNCIAGTENANCGCFVCHTTKDD
jgi:hypothetical protein